MCCVCTRCVYVVIFNCCILLFVFALYLVLMCFLCVVSMILFGVCIICWSYVISKGLLRVFVSDIMIWMLLDIDSIR